MTNEEFSNGFDTLISAYQHSAEFGEQSSLFDASFDEYEKSLFLTQAQEELVKQHFEKYSHPQQIGFDDSATKQMGYSTLITVKSIYASDTTAPSKGTSFDSSIIPGEGSNENSGTNTGEDTGGNTDIEIEGYAENSTIFDLSTVTDILLIINEKVQCTPDTSDTSEEATESTKPPVSTSKWYTIVPIHYKEYDRMMSKAYNQPLKRQAWRIFHGSNYAEIITRHDAGSATTYRIRYVRRPNPIILVDLTGTPNGLTINGKRSSECELHPILHNDILTLAVRLALASRGIQTQEAQAAAKSQNND